MTEIDRLYQLADKMHEVLLEQVNRFMQGKLDDGYFNELAEAVAAYEDFRYPFPPVEE
jgi:hypothetical protein